MEAVRGGITAPAGFTAAGVFCGIKRRGKDLALIVSDRPATAVGTLTTNKMRASSVEWAADILKRGKARAIVANSGNANCCTGRQGEKDTREMARTIGTALGVPRNQVFVGSTGVIGQPLPMNRLRHGIRKAAGALSRTGSHAAAEAILTTDTRPKEIAFRFPVEGKPVTVAGIAKGAGMIAPNMATMLAFLTTDAPVNRVGLQNALRFFVPRTFNAVTVDGEMSTNDMVLLMANGAAPVPMLRLGSRAYRDFFDAVGRVCKHLAHEIARDGEGVTRLFTIRVTGAARAEQAEKIARQIANSLLVKTMVAGRDPNWGRVAAAVGAAGVPFRPGRLTLRLGQTVVFRNGEPTHPGREKLLEEVDRQEVVIGVELGQGREEAQMLSTDLTEDYVRINAKYTT